MFRSSRSAGHDFQWEAKIFAGHRKSYWLQQGKPTFHNRCGQPSHGSLAPTTWDYLHSVDDQRIVYINTLMFINVFLARHKYTGLCLNCQLLSVVCPWAALTHMSLWIAFDCLCFESSHAPCMHVLPRPGSIKLGEAPSGGWLLITWALHSFDRSVAPPMQLQMGHRIKICMWATSTVVYFGRLILKCFCRLPMAQIWGPAVLKLTNVAGYESQSNAPGQRSYCWCLFSEMHDTRYKAINGTSQKQ